MCPLAVDIQQSVVPSVWDHVCKHTTWACDLSHPYLLPIVFACSLYRFTVHVIPIELLAPSAHTYPSTTFTLGMSLVSAVFLSPFINRITRTDTYGPLFDRVQTPLSLSIFSVWTFWEYCNVHTHTHTQCQCQRNVWLAFLLGVSSYCTHVRPLRSFPYSLRQWAVLSGTQRFEGAFSHSQALSFPWTHLHLKCLNDCLDLET